jgi:hypothetical protein
MKKLAIVFLIMLFPALLYAAAGDTWTIQPSYPDVRQPIGTPGSISNPYQATERYDGSIEIKPSYPDVRQPLGTPGSYTNPIIIKPNRW